MMTSLHRRRAGFTLIELIVVIGIILLLMALTLSAVFRLRETQLEKNSTASVRKIDIGFQQQWKATIDAIKKEKIPPAVREATRSVNGEYDPPRAAAMHMMLRMRQEFPQNFGEAQDQYTTGSYAGVPAYTYAGKPIYALAFKNPVLIGSENEAAAMLYLILSSGHGGISFDAEKAAPIKVWNFPQQSGPDVQLKVFMDEWGSPISFRRVADDDSQALLAELNQPPFVTPAQVQSGRMNMFDPEGRLPIQGWPEYGSVKAYFTQPLQNKRPYILNPFDNLNRGPFVFSAGKDKQWYPPNDQDNLYSFRIQQSGKGN